MARSANLLCCRSLGLLLLLPAAAPVHAGERWQGVLALTSDYVHRGISRSSGGPALQGSVTYWNPTGWYAGAWGSQIDTRDAPYGHYTEGADLELNVFAGLSRRLDNDWVVDLRAVGYWFPGDPAPVNYDYFELGVNVAWSERIYASLAISPRTNWLAYAGDARNRPAYDVGLAVQQPLSAWLTLIVGSGYHELVAPGVTGYLYGSASLVLQWRRCSFELGYYDADDQARQLFGDPLAGARTVFTASVSF